MNRHFVLADLDRYGPGTTTAPPDLAESQQYCCQLARRHYENFTVVGWLLPRRLRQHFYNVYSWCRWADDLADEIPAAAPNEAGQGGDAADPGIKMLRWWQDELDACYHGTPRHPVTIALRETIREFGIPTEPFHDLISAFGQDRTKNRYRTYEEVLDYCRRSANPVGRLVLYLGESHTPDNVVLSDSICTGLQLANFWQDVSEDFHLRQRVYLPQEEMEEFGVSEEELAQGVGSPRFRRLICFQVRRTEALLRSGFPLVEKVEKDIAVDVALFLRGGLAVLDGIRQQKYDVLRRRPKVSRWQKLRLLLSACWPGGISGRWIEKQKNRSDSLQESYCFCRRMTRQAGSSFYASFLLLPKAKRNAMSVLYAFLRHTDDLADSDEPLEIRQQRVEHWRTALDKAQHGRFLEPILPAIIEVVEQHQIPMEHLIAVIDGVASDLTPRHFETFEQLVAYCHLVATAVGLCCIRIWGLRDGRDFDAPEIVEPARACGLALQLTNILRDIAEDAANGRVYLPREDLQRFGVTEDDLKKGQLTEPIAQLIEFEVQRIEGFYKKAEDLAQYLSPEGRRSFRIVVEVYHSLLREIKRRKGDVFTERVRLGRMKKLSILFRGYFS